MSDGNPPNVKTFRMLLESDPVRYSIPDMQYNLICHQRSTKVSMAKIIVPDK